MKDKLLLCAVALALAACSAKEEAPKQALVVAGRLREATNALRFDDIDPALRVGVSIGAAQARKAGDSCDALIDRADAALYRAKQQGRDRVES